MKHRLTPVILAVLIGCVVFTEPLLADLGQSPSASQTQGRTIHVKDGDRIVVEGSGRVDVIRRREGVARVLFNPAQRWVIVLFDGAPDPVTGQARGVDDVYTFNALNPDWPFGERWDGAAVLEEYSSIGEPGPRFFGLGLKTAQGSVQLLGGPGAELIRDPAVSTVVTYRGSGRGGGGRRPFDETELRQVAIESSNFERRGQLPGGRPSVDSYVGMSVSGVSGATGTAQESAGMQAPVRVGGNVRTPRRITHVPAVYPERARGLRIEGLVILEITIGTDGRVTAAKVLRSIPMLDTAALDAVRQWRYEPTEVNGVPVPVVMTVTVSFP